MDLNGELCSIGSISDCIYQFATSDNIDFEIQIDDKAYKWSFTSEITNLSDTFIKVSGNGSPSIESDNVIFNNNFQYISAFRNGPVNDYDKDTSSVELLNQISRREVRCELVAHFLYFFKSNIVSDALIVSPETDHSLTMQVEAWMGEISPNINIHVQPNDTSFKINYSYNRGTGKVKTNEFKASNIGFGVSYALPIVVATLQACSKSKRTPEENLDKFIVIENPEAHIHPSGQEVKISVENQNVVISSLSTNNEISMWFAKERIPSRNFHVIEKHGENRSEERRVKGEHKSTKMLQE